MLGFLRQEHLVVLSDLLEAGSDLRVEILRRDHVEAGFLVGPRVGHLRRSSLGTLGTLGTLGPTPESHRAELLVALRRVGHELLDELGKVGREVNLGASSQLVEVPHEVGLDLHAARGGLLALELGHRVFHRSRLGEPVDERVEGVVVRGGETTRAPSFARQQLVHGIRRTLLLGLMRFVSVRVGCRGRCESPRGDLVTQRLDLRVESRVVHRGVIVGVRVSVRHRDVRCRCRVGIPVEAEVVVVAPFAVGVAQDGPAPWGWPRRGFLRHREPGYLSRALRPAALSLGRPGQRKYPAQ